VGSGASRGDANRGFLLGVHGHLQRLSVLGSPPPSLGVNDASDLVKSGHRREIRTAGHPAAGPATRARCRACRDGPGHF
jgi:hypothetical protein